MQSTDQSDTGALRLASSDCGHRSGTHLVLVHGFTQSAASWDSITNELCTNRFVSAVDLPGHGRSTQVRVADLDETARLLGATAGRAIYIGYSLGARVALTLAVQSPELVEALVLVSGSPGIAESKSRNERRQRDEILADRLNPNDGSASTLTIETFLEEWLAQPLFAHLDDESSDQTSRRVNSTQGLAHSLRSSGAGMMRPLHQDLRALEIPVLCLAGELDIRYTEIAKLMAESIGENAHVEIIPDAGHAVPFEQPGAFLHSLEEFLDRNHR